MNLQVQSRKQRSDRVNKVVERVLNQILGREAAKVVYYHLENSYSIQKDEITGKLDSFNQALEAYLGTGAEVIEKLIRENLQFDDVEENRDLDFLERQRILKLA